MWMTTVNAALTGNSGISPTAHVQNQEDVATREVVQLAPPKGTNLMKGPAAMRSTGLNKSVVAVEVVVAAFHQVVVVLLREGSHNSNNPLPSAMMTWRSCNFVAGLKS